jgi:hypothetical protein
MALVDSRPGTPAVHALAIGVGEYPWLPGGTQPTFAKHGGMGQLTSAPISARRFASWLLGEFVHPEFPGRTLELLISEAGGAPFVDPSGTSQAVARATFSNINQAVLDWFGRGNASADDLLICFFCGHGLGKGKQTILLAEDFGSLPATLSLQFAVDFDQFHLGMDLCAARRQCFFVDACRVGTPFALNTLQYFGNPIVPPEARVSPAVRSAPIYYSAVPGSTAYGRTGEPSLFTDALLQAFRGAGADDATGTWIVGTDVLHRGIHTYLQRAVARAAGPVQLSTVDGIASPFALHHLSSDPIVPVEVTCRPDSHNPTGTLRVTGGPNPLTPPAPAKGSWDLDLPIGAYRFQIDLPAPASSPAPIDRDVRPPYRRVEFPVS